jgi:glycosyltransferase involved in cell wall biosynthesis
LERTACRLSDALFVDTAAKAETFHRSYGVPLDRFYPIPTGADERIFYPQPRTRPDDGRLHVIYVGGFLVAHGLPTIIEAADLLRDEAISFDFIGSGPERARAQALAAEHGLSHVTFTDWIDRREVPERMAQADVVLGAFANTVESLQTIHNKVYEGMAMGLPVVSGDSATVRASLRDGEDLVLVPRENAAALAAALLALKADPQRRAAIGATAYRTFTERFTTSAISALAESHLRRILNGS